MPRKPPVEEHENLERWLVSYADFITLLFAFFVVMYAISSINEGKYRVLSDSLISAFREQTHSPKPIEMGAKHAEILQGTGKPIGKSQPVLPPEPGGPGEPTEKMKKVAKNVLEAMAPLIKEGQVRVLQSPRGITVEINASTLFASGDAVLTGTSMQALTEVAKVLAEVDNPIRVEGHTDNVPISLPTFPSNWELSSARAGSVVRLFMEQGVAPSRMVAIGYADNKPVDTNTTPEGRGRNRRVNVLILHENKGPTEELSLEN